MRVLVGSDSLIPALFVGADGETPADADDLPVAIVTDWAGQVLGDPATVAKVTGTGQYTVLVDHEQHTSMLDRLTVTLTGTAGGFTRVVAIAVEVVGAHIATLPELQAEPGASDASRVQLVAARDHFAEIVEQFLGGSPVPRLGVETITGIGRDRCGSDRMRIVVALDAVDCRALRAVVLDGVELDLDDFDLDPAGVLTTSGTTFAHLDTAGPHRLAIAYEYGASAPTQLVHDAGVIYVAQHITRTNSAMRDVIAQTFDGQMIRYSTPDFEEGRPTGYLDPDRMLCACPRQQIGIG